MRFLKIKGAAAVRLIMNKREQKLKNRGSCNARATVLIMRWITQNFQTEGEKSTPGGWKPLAQSTIDRRRKGKGEGKSDKILQDTGHLKNDWKAYWDYKIAEVKSSTEYGKLHDEPGPGSHIPQRKILPTKEQIMPELLKLYGQFVKVSIR